MAFHTVCAPRSAPHGRTFRSPFPGLISCSRVWNQAKSIQYRVAYPAWNSWGWTAPFSAPRRKSSSCTPSPPTPTNKASTSQRFLAILLRLRTITAIPQPKKNNTHTHAHTPKLAPNEPRSSANPLIKKWIEMVDRHFIEYWGTPIYCNNETFDRFQVSELWYCSNIYVFIQHGSNKLECLLGKSSISRYVVLLLFVLLDLTVGNWLRGPQHYSARWMAHIIYINIIFHLFCSVNLHLSVNFRTHVYNVHIYI